MKKWCYSMVGLIYISMCVVLFSHQTSAEEEDESIILEVEGDVDEHATYIEDHFPYVELVATYDTLFKGVALKIPKGKTHKIASMDFIQSIHPARTYELPTSGSDHDVNQGNAFPGNAPFPENTFSDADSQNEHDALATFPNDLNDTSYTGKGVKVGVIDTGIDYTHPDLQANYVGGYDLVDLDADPMESTGGPNEETIHGTHVAGIIAADGDLQGVAPDAELYAYRALGEGGMGTTIQVLAAMEKAVKDDVDVINLSLGNAVNGPDYPTSVAVNRAVDLGISVVIASGNDGPDEWTVGSPATASKAITVGATAQPMEVPSLYEGKHDKDIPFNLFLGSVPWDLQKDYQMVSMDDEGASLQGKIALAERGDVPFYDMAKEAQDKGARALLIYHDEQDPIPGTVENIEKPVTIPVGSLSHSDGKWLVDKTKKDSLYLDTTYHETPLQVADFSSRGPVTITWEIKPDILAPGVNIFSTVPGGYQMLQGTSMATPHVTGVLALLKEAHPDWTPDELKAAIDTTAATVSAKDDERYPPSTQGMGQIQPNKAIQSSTVIDAPFLSFGKIDDGQREETKKMTIANTSDQTKQYRFSIPKANQGIMWDIPQTFSLEANEEKTVEVGMRAIPSVLKEGIHQGYLTLEEQDDTYHLPYLFINKSADNPKAMGFELSLKTLSDDTYQYQLYVTEPAKRVTVDLYDPDTLIYQRHFLELKDVKVGNNEGELKKSKVGEPGHYKAIITVELEDGTFESYESEVMF